MNKLKSGLISILLSLVLMLSFSAITNAQASSTSCDLKKSGPLGIPTWYKYMKGEVVEAKKGTETIKICKILMYTTTATEIGSDPDKAGINLSKNITAIGLAVVEILLRILVYIAIVWGIWGGYEIIVSGGNSQGFKNGINRVRNAAIGMVLGIISTPLITFVASKVI